NAEAGRFALIIDGTETIVQADGSTPAATNVYGHITGYFVPSGNGVHTVGVRITRPFLVPAGLNQYVDNFTTTAPDFADPRFDSGNLASWNVANTGNGVGAPGTV